MIGLFVTFIGIAGFVLANGSMSSNTSNEGEIQEHGRVDTVMNKFENEFFVWRKIIITHGGSAYDIAVESNILSSIFNEALSNLFNISVTCTRFPPKVPSSD
jgi:hypothetical protein